MTGKKKSISFLLFLFFIIVLNADVFNFINTIKSQLGDYFYPLDDTYIHLAIAKNFSDYGIWGVTKHQFSSTSSSPLFTLLLTLLVKIFGNHQSIPLYLNILLGNVLIILFYRTFKEKPIQLFIVYVGFILGVLLKIQIISGMEHMLQLLIVCTCWIYFYKWYLTEYTDKIYGKIFYIAVTLTCITRYESLFFATPLILFLLLSKKYKHGIIAGLLAYVPILIFGLYAINEGGHFFPNTLLVKGKHSFSQINLFYDFLVTKNFIASNFYFYLIVILILFSLSKYLFDKGRILNSIRNILKDNLVFSIVIINLVGHLMFAGTGWLYRYDAYLIGLLIISIAFSVDKISHNSSYSIITVAVIFSLLLADSFKDRYKSANQVIAFANKNIYDQQIQVANLLKKYFNNSTIIANDIGAITYFSNIKLYDLTGLASTDMLNIKNNPEQFNHYVNSLNYDLMVVYDSWFTNLKMKNRIKIAELTIQNNKVCGEATVSFYLPADSKIKEYAYNSFKQFQKEIPKDVTLNIFEIQPKN